MRHRRRSGRHQPRLPARSMRTSGCITGSADRSAGLELRRAARHDHRRRSARCATRVGGRGRGGRLRHPLPDRRRARARRLLRAPADRGRGVRRGDGGAASGCPSFVDNDANLALLAEHRHGAARGERVALMLTLGTGVGGAILIGGELFRGAQGAAGELGPHDRAAPDGPAVRARAARATAAWSRWSPAAALARDALARGAARAATADSGGRSPAGRDGRAGRWSPSSRTSGDRGRARRAATRSASGSGIGLVSLVNIFNPDVVVIGGGVIGAGELILEPARRVLASARARAAGGACRGARRALRRGAGMLGAAVFARESGRARRVAA